MKWFRDFPAENIILDVALIAAFYFAPDPGELIKGDLYTALLLFVPFQLFAIACSFVHDGQESDAPGTYFQHFVSLMWCLCLVFAALISIWLRTFIEAAEIQQGVISSWIKLLMFSGLFIGTTSAAIFVKLYPVKKSMYLWLRYVTVLIVGISLFVMESFIQVSFEVLDSDISSKWIVLLASYLPIRLLLALRGPYSGWDFFSALFFFVLSAYFFFH